jgi:hypothetical protein
LEAIIGLQSKAIADGLSRTLQELLTPQHVEFYDKNWHWCGDREHNYQDLAKATKIHPFVLCSPYKPSDERWSIADRMSWVSTRETTRPEDMVYCLLGIFAVHMSPLYGEGVEKAFRRLQEEIMKTSTDLSILAWFYPGLYHPSCLAPTPRWFSYSRSIRHDGEDGGPDTDHFSMTNKGLLITLPLIVHAQPSKDPDSSTSCTALLPRCYFANEPNGFMSVGIRLREVSSRTWSSETGGQVPVYSKIYTEEPVAVHAAKMEAAKWTKMYLQ